mgnify:CR=1 FL=1
MGDFVDTIGIPEVLMLSFALLGMLVLLILIPFKGDDSPRVNTFFNWVYKAVFWNLFLRMFIESFLEWGHSSIESIYLWEQHFILLIFHSLRTAFLASLMAISYVFVKKNRHRINDPKWSHSMGSLTPNIYQRWKNFGQQFIFVFMCRRLVYIMIILFLAPWPFAQIQTVVFKSSLTLTYLGYYVPFNTKWLNR